MLLTIDVGNTNISCGIFDNEKLITTFRFITKQNRTPDEIALQIHSVLEVRHIVEEQITDVIISSVVPKLNNDLITAIRQCFAIEPFMIKTTSNTGVKIEIDEPSSCGIDLLVDIIAAYNIYKKECLVVDFGTATKFLYVGNNCEFKSAVIAPGFEIFSNTLWQSTAQLPQVQLHKPDKVLGTNTISCMQSGIVNGYVALTKGIIDGIQKEVGHPLTIIATGGQGKLIAEEIPEIHDYESNLAYYGMKYIYDLNKEK